MARNRSPIPFEELFETLEFVGGDGPFENEAFLDTESGRIRYRPDWVDPDDPLPDDLDDNPKYIALPGQHDLGLGRLPFRFTSEVLPDEIDAVHAMFRGRGAYRRFKDWLDRRGLLTRWYEFEDARKRQALRERCDNEELDVRG